MASNWVHLGLSSVFGVLKSWKLPANKMSCNIVHTFNCSNCKTFDICQNCQKSKLLAKRRLEASFRDGKRWDFRFCNRNTRVSVQLEGDPSTLASPWHPFYYFFFFLLPIFFTRFRSSKKKKIKENRNVNTELLTNATRSALLLRWAVFRFFVFFFFLVFGKGGLWGAQGA